MANNVYRKILWAIDAIGGDEKVQLNTAKVIRALTKNGKTTVVPVSVVTPPTPYLLRGRLLDLLEEENHAVEERLASFVKKSGIKNLKPIVIRKNRYSSGESVSAFLSYAKKINADLLVVSTHSRKGIRRAIAGSFAESLYLHSKIPVLVVNAHTKVPQNIKHILFPTDFSLTAEKVFSSVLKLAKAIGAKVTIFHKVEVITEFSSSTFHGAPMYRDYLANDIKNRKEIGKHLVRKGEKAGVKCTFKLNDGSLFPEQAIMKYAKKQKVDLIAMSSHSGAVASTILGSVSRQVVRGAQCPVWIIHPPKMKNAARAMASAKTGYAKSL